MFRALADRERDANPKVADVGFLRRAGRQLDAVEDDAGGATAAAAAIGDAAPASQSQAGDDGDGAHGGDAAASAAPGTPAAAAAGTSSAAGATTASSTSASSTSSSTRSGVTPADSDRENRTGAGGGEGVDGNNSGGGKAAPAAGAVVPLPRLAAQTSVPVLPTFGSSAADGRDGGNAAAVSSSSSVAAPPPAPRAPPAVVSWMGEDVIKRYPDLLEFVAHARGWMVDAGLAEIMRPATWGGRASKSESVSMWDVVADYRRRTARTVPRPPEQRWWWGALPAGLRSRLERVVDGGERQRASAAAANAAAYRGYGRYAGAYGRGGADEDDNDLGGGGASAGSSSSSAAAAAPEVNLAPDMLYALTAALEDFSCGPLASASTLDNRRPGPAPIGPDGAPLPLELLYPRATLQPAGKTEATRTNLRKDIRKL